MRMRGGECWHCVNPNCKCEVIVRATGNVEGLTNPRCCCGTPMKRQYGSPVFRAIDAPELETIQHKTPVGPR